VKDTIIQLYPLANQEVPIKKLYLQHNLLERQSVKGSIFIYSNFITSLDGRIAIPRASGKGMKVPESIANPRDWRLFQELAVQADILITSGRYLRDYAKGHSQEILQVYDDPAFADLKEWRQDKGFQPLPDLAVISKSLDFPIPEVLTHGDRAVHVITTQDADPARIHEIEQGLGNLIFAGEKLVDGQELALQLANLGYRTVYSTAGPKVFHLLLSADVLDRLYLTHASRILGGEPFSSILEGNLLETPVDFELKSLYLDPKGLEGLGQLFSCYDRV